MVIIKDEQHSTQEDRLFCIDKVNDQILTIRYVHRDGIIRIFGAAEWRKWREYYEQENNQ